MIDFKATSSGDIAIEQATNYDKFKLMFRIADYPVMLVTFDTELQKIADKPKNKFEFNFDINLVDLHKYSKCTTIKDVSELAQAIAIRLKTEFGEIEALKDIGSNLILERHKDIKAETVLENVKTDVQDAISDILEDYTIEITRLESDGNFRLETLNIAITDDEGNIIFENQV